MVKFSPKKKDDVITQDKCFWKKKFFAKNTLYKSLEGTQNFRFIAAMVIKFPVMKMPTCFADLGRILQERDKCEVPGNWWSVSTGEMGWWCDTEDCKLLEIL